MNFYKRHLGAYAKKTAHLSLTEHGAYQVLLDTYYSTGKPLPAAKDELYRIARAMSTAERRAVDRVADEFFPVNGDGSRHNHRADEELASYSTQAETNRRIAIEREAKRKEHEQSTNRATKRQPNSEFRSKPPPNPHRLTAAFVRFWEVYPKRVAKGRAERAFAKLNPDDELLQRMLTAIEAQIASEKWRKESGRFIPHPATWLNDRGWEDELAEAEQPRFPI